MRYCIKRIKNMRFTVENCPSNGITYCLECKSIIQKQEIRIKIIRICRNSLFYHLECFIPEQFTLKNYINIKLDQNSQEIFYNWLNRRNSELFPLDQGPIIPYTSNVNIPYLTVINRRPLIEIFKFLSANELFLISKVSKSFYQIAHEEEIWKFLLNRDYQITDFETAPRSLYIKLYNENCYECKRIPDTDFSRCPMLRRTLCLKCLKLSKYRLLCKRDIKLFFGIDSAFLDLKYWKSKESESVVVTYQFLVEQGLRRFRFRQKNRIMEMIHVLGDDHPASRIINSIDLDDIDDITGDDSYISHPKYLPKYDLNIRFKFYKKVVDFVRCGKPKLNRQKIVKLIRKEIIFD